MNDPSQMLSRPYGMWQPPVGFRKNGKFNMKSKKTAGKRKKAKSGAGPVARSAPGIMWTAEGCSGVPGYMPPTMNELLYQTRVKTKRFYPKKKFNRFAPFAPRNTTSYIIRAKKYGGIASLISPCPATPAILRTPAFSPSMERLVDMAREELGVDGYGSMKGLICLRSPTVNRGDCDEEDDDDDGSCESYVEEHLEMERRLDNDLSRFEIVYPNVGEEQGGAAACRLENRVDDQDAHITDLEEENLTLKERIYLIEREMGDLRMRMLLLETDFRADNQIVPADVNDGNNLDDGGEVC